MMKRYVFLLRIFIHWIALTIFLSQIIQNYLFIFSAQKVNDGIPPLLTPAESSKRNRSNHNNSIHDYPIVTLDKISQQVVVSMFCFNYEYIYTDRTIYGYIMIIVLSFVSFWVVCRGLISSSNVNLSNLKQFTVGFIKVVPNVVRCRSYWSMGIPTLGYFVVDAKKYHLNLSPSNYLFLTIFS